MKKILKFLFPLSTKHILEFVYNLVSDQQCHFFISITSGKNTIFKMDGRGNFEKCSHLWAERIPESGRLNYWRRYKYRAPLSFGCPQRLEHWAIRYIWDRSHDLELATRL